MKKPMIIVMGANPAWQKTLIFHQLSPGAVNRAAREAMSRESEKTNPAGEAASEPESGERSTKTTGMAGPAMSRASAKEKTSRRNRMPSGRSVPTRARGVSAGLGERHRWIRPSSRRWHSAKRHFQPRSRQHRLILPNAASSSATDSEWAMRTVFDFFRMSSPSPARPGSRRARQGRGVRFIL